MIERIVEGLKHGYRARIASCWDGAHLRPAILLLLGLFAAIYAQGFLDQHRNTPWDGGILLVGAAVIWALGLRAATRADAGDDADSLVGEVAAGLRDLDIDGSASPTPPAFTPERRRLALIGIGLVLAVAFIIPWVFQTVFGTDGGALAVIDYEGPDNPNNEWGKVGLPVWILGVLLYLWAVMDRGGLARLRDRIEPEGLRFRVSWSGLALLGILVLAAVYRLYDLAGVPGQMTSDHTEKLLDVFDLTQRGITRAYFPRNTGREPFQFYWTALFVKLGMPVTYHTLKFALCSLSVAAVAATYHAARQVGGKVVGLAAAFILAVAPWDIQIARVGLRYDLGPIFTAFTLAFLLYALTSGRRNAWLAAAAAAAVGLNGYTAFRAVVLLVPAVILAWAYGEWRAGRLGELRGAAGRALSAHLLGSAGLAFLMLAPLARFALDFPDIFWSRVLTRSTGAEEALISPLQQFFINWKNALLMVNVTSDSAWLVSPPFRPALETVGGALFVLGLVTALWRIRRGDWRPAAMILAALVMIAPSVMALAFPREVPHLARAGGALPAVVTLAALSVGVLIRRCRALAGAPGVLLMTFVLALLGGRMAANTWQRYFVEYREHFDKSTHHTQDGARAIAAFLDAGGSMENVFLIGWDDGWDYRALGIMSGDYYWGNLIGSGSTDWSSAVDEARLHAESPAAKLYITAGPSAETQIARFRELYPEAYATHYEHPLPDKDFWTITVPARGG